MAIFEPAKYNRRIWAVLDIPNCAYHYIGMGKKYCIEKCKELNAMYNELLQGEA